MKVEKGRAGGVGDAVVECVALEDLPAVIQTIAIAREDARSGLKMKWVAEQRRSRMWLRCCERELAQIRAAATAQTFLLLLSAKVNCQGYGVCAPVLGEDKSTQHIGATSSISSVPQPTSSSNPSRASSLAIAIVWITAGRSSKATHSTTASPTPPALPFSTFISAS